MDTDEHKEEQQPKEEETPKEQTKDIKLETTRKTKYTYIYIYVFSVKKYFFIWGRRLFICWGLNPIFKSVEINGEKINTSKGKGMLLS